MKILLAAALSLSATVALAQSHDLYGNQNNEFFGSGLGSVDVDTNAYGLGMGMDPYGRPVPHDPALRVTPDAYGLGIGMDQYGRPIR